MVDSCAGVDNIDRSTGRVAFDIKGRGLGKLFSEGRVRKVDCRNAESAVRAR